MKKPIVIIFFTLFLLIGCSKSYTCSCTDGGPTIVSTEEIEAENKKDAQDYCSSRGEECSIL